MQQPRATKVICYVVRDGQLLVFRHRDYPEAGVQVPAGTVRDGEPPADAALRETEEETGRAGFAIVGKLGVYEYEFHDRFRGGERHELHERHVFVLAPPPDLPERWSHLAEPGAGRLLVRVFLDAARPEPHAGRRSARAAFTHLALMQDCRVARRSRGRDK